MGSFSLQRQLLETTSSSSICERGDTCRNIENHVEDLHFRILGAGRARPHRSTLVCGGSPGTYMQPACLGQVKADGEADRQFFAWGWRLLVRNFDCWTPSITPRTCLEVLSSLCYLAPNERILAIRQIRQSTSNSSLNWWKADIESPHKRLRPSSYFQVCRKLS